MNDSEIQDIGYDSEQAGSSEPFAPKQDMHLY